jgi:anti-sigma factor RsiW
MMPANSCGLSEQAIEQYAMNQMARKQLPRFEQHLLLCDRCQRAVVEADTFVAAVRSALSQIELDKEGAERRNEPRRLCKRKVEVRVRGTRRLVLGRATDMSRGGFGLTVGDVVPAGARIVLSTGGKQYDGEVAWCAPQGTVYRLGVRLAA